MGTIYRFTESDGGPKSSSSSSNSSCCPCTILWQYHHEALWCVLVSLAEQFSYQLLAKSSDGWRIANGNGSEFHVVGPINAKLLCPPVNFIGSWALLGFYFLFERAVQKLVGWFSLSAKLLFRFASTLGYLTRKPSCRWQTRATPAKSLHGLHKSSGVVSCIARLPVDSLPMVSYYVLYSNYL